MVPDLKFSKENFTGFLSDDIPLRHSNSNQPDVIQLDQLANSIPKLLLTNKIRYVADNLDKSFFSHNLTSHSEAEIKLFNVQFSFLAHAYVWGDENPATVLPSSISVPWKKISDLLGRPPILSYGSYCLDNWHKIIQDEEISLDNVALNYNFLAGIDEDWFVTIHVCIEDAAREAILATLSIADSFAEQTVSDSAIQKHLVVINTSMKKVNEIFKRVPEKCDPYVYYHRVRPYIFGWKNNPALPNGLIYEGCYDNRPQLFRGETGAQSSIVPTLDALFNVVHERDELRDYLDEMKTYMPPAHRQVIEYVENHSTLKNYVDNNATLKSLYNECINEVTVFRNQHLQYAADYIHSQSTKNTSFGSGGSVVRGTGGTPFMKYLKKHRDETDSSKIHS